MFCFIFSPKDCFEVFRRQVHFHLTQIDIMSFSKGRQSPDNSKNNYCSMGHHNIIVKEKASIPPLEKLNSKQRVSPVNLQFEFFVYVIKAVARKNL